MKLYRVTTTTTMDVWAQDARGAIGLAVTAASKAADVENGCMNVRVESGTVREWREPVEPVQVKP